MFNVLRLVSVALSVLLLSGCLAYSRHPLSVVGEAIVDPALTGDWYALLEEEEDERLDVHVAASDGHRLAVTTAEKDGDGKQKIFRYVAHLSELEGNRYLNVLEADAPDRGYRIVKYRISGPMDLHCSLIDDEALKAAVRAGEISGVIEGDTEFADVVITAPPEELRRFIARREATLFRREVTLRRSE